MLSPDKVSARERDEWDVDSGDSDTIDVDALIVIAKRQWRVVAACVVICMAIAFIYLTTAVPLYTAQTSVLIDRSNSEIVNQLSTFGSVLDDEPSVLSQVELLKSESVAIPVVRQLKLHEDPRFTQQLQSPISAAIKSVRSLLDFSKWFADAEEVTGDEESQVKAVASGLLGSLRIERVGRSYVLRISYISPYPDLAMKVANAVADAYLVDKLNSKYDATRRASDWLQQRIDELKSKALESDLAVQRFRTENGLVTADGVLITDQQLAELNSALIVAQAETAKARARYDRIKAILESGQTDAIVTDVLGSSISNELRRKYLDASKLEADISRRLGSNHIQAIRLRGEMKELQRLMFDELGRIAESYQSDVTVAEAREEALRKNVAEAQGVTAIAGETQVQLRELERTADSYKNLYQTFLQRFQEATQQQSFPITEARVISRADTPTAPSSPRKTTGLALSMMMGLALGGMVGAFREFRDRFFRTGEQVRDNLGTEFLGSIPLVPASEVKRGQDSETPRGIRRVSTITNYVIDHPLSAYAETLRSTKIAVDLASGVNGGGKVIGFISTLPGEGKSTTAINFAALLAMQGARTLLIDADLRNPGATRAIGRHAEAGILEALIEDKPLRDLLLYDAKTKLAFLPAVVTRRVPHSSELLASPAMQAIINKAQENFDYIILDLPPLAPVVDARAIASRIDSFVYVVEWGGTSRKAVRSAFTSDPEIMRKCAGVILNKVDEQKMNLYRVYGSSDYYYSRYVSYYHEK